VLCAFKYYNFFVESFSALFRVVGIEWHPLMLQMMLPVGISFFTFQALSYTFDVYFKKMQPTRNVVEFFTFIAFFPQLVAGPIERASNLLPQFQRARRFDPEVASHGICLMIYGLFKKMVVADTLSVYVDQTFNNCAFFNSSLTCILAAFFFSIQIYCDFSGYSDIARGVARLFGFELMVNFNRPYLATSFTDFWRRWHISLSTWFKDYVYIPLGGNRVGTGKVLRNLWVVFLLSGLWHGASWTFVAWGALHAAFQSIAILKNKLFKKPERFSRLRTIGAILFVNMGVIFAWLLFRAQDFGQFKLFVRTMVYGDYTPSLMALCAGMGPLHFLFCWIAVGLLAVSYLFPADCKIKKMPLQLLFAILFILAIIFFGMPSGGEFIYFQF
jgi:D-alanyl-lipoteichoic acid acyltransferase DltB (MBOAT superfamily)